MRRPELAPDDRLDELLDESVDGAIRGVMSVRGESPLLKVERDDPRRRLRASMPDAGRPVSEVLDELDSVLAVNRRRNAHAGMFGYVCGSGLPTDPLGHALAAAHGQNVTGFGSAPGATAIEVQLVDWFIALAGLPKSASGMLVSGGSVSNLTAIAVAVQRGVDPRGGLFAGARPIVYASATAHFSVLRSVRMMGIGRDGLRFVPTDDAGAMRADRLAELVRADRQREDVRPAVVIATAGTTARGAIDPLEAIAELCAAEGLFFHVDAAYGGAALLSPRLAPLFRGIERADSLTIDLHKWMYTTFDASLLLYRNPDDARRVFFERADYALAPSRDNLRNFAFYHQGLETSRRFRALAPWLALNHYGRSKLARNIEHNVDCARWLGQRVSQDPNLELVGEPSLSIANFRARLTGRDARQVDRVTEAVREDLQREGEFFLSATNIEGRPVLRVCVLSPSTDADTIESLVARCSALVAKNAQALA